VYLDSEYEEAGAELKDDLCDATIILGVKPVEIPNLIPNRAYFMFSHTIKAQPENMGLLDTCVCRNISLFDYECIVNEEGQRLLAFGEFAGIVGVNDILLGLGQRLLADGYATPFLNVPLSYMALSLASNFATIKSLGDRIRTEGLPAGLGPIVFAFTGAGNVGKGARCMFELLPVTLVTAEELPSLAQGARQREKTIYGCYLETKHLVRKTDQGNRGSETANETFDKAHYYAHPEDYEPVFHTNIAPYITVLINGMYWDNKFPCLLTISQASSLPPAKNDVGRRFGTPSLRAIADITCDLGNRAL
jgi:alpha-aminoadipic semialdehyde synthase